MWHHDRSRARQNRQARTEELERELGIEPGPEVELSRLAEQIKALSAQRQDIEGSSASMPNVNREPELREVDRVLRHAIRQVYDANEELILLR